jgi:hypothetical protein
MVGLVFVGQRAVDGRRQSESRLAKICRLGVSIRPIIRGEFISSTKNHKCERRMQIPCAPRFHTHKNILLIGPRRRRTDILPRPPAAQLLLLHNIHSGNGVQFVRNITDLAQWDGSSDTEGLNTFAVLCAVEDALQTIYREESRSVDKHAARTRGWG